MENLSWLGENVLGSIPLVVCGVIMFFTIRRMKQKATEEDIELQKLGFLPIKAIGTKFKFSMGIGQFGGFLPKSQGKYQGEFQGWPAGYRAGDKVVSKMWAAGGADDDFGAISGAELWLDMGLICPSLCIIERGDAYASQIADHLAGTMVVEVGDSAFDQRFVVRCADPQWAKLLLDDSCRRRLLNVPYMFLILRGSEAIFSLTLSQRAEIYWKLGLSLNSGPGLLSYADQFLTALAIVATSALKHRDRMLPITLGNRAPNAVPEPARVSTLLRAFVKPLGFVVLFWVLITVGSSLLQGLFLD